MCTEKFSFFLLNVFIVCVYIHQSSLKWYQSCKKKWLDCCRITQQKKYILYVRRPLYMCEWVITLARLGHHSGAEFQAKNKREPSEREREREKMKGRFFLSKPCWWICGGLFLVNSDNEHDLFVSLEIRLRERGSTFDRHFSNV
jgi:hypothetical protein